MATRLAARRLRAAGIVLEPLLKRAGLSVSQINKQDEFIAVASQIEFLELAANALGDHTGIFRSASDGDLRQARPSTTPRQRRRRSAMRSMTSSATFQSSTQASLCNASKLAI